MSGTDEWTVTTVTASAEATRRVAEGVARASRPGDLVLLVGGLGAGKTTFAQGFGRGLGVAGPVTSPTFTLVRQYQTAGAPAGVAVLLHADVYRLDSLAEVVDLGLHELIEDGAVALVEWGDVAAPALGSSALTVTLTAGAGTPAGDDPIGADGGDELRTVTATGRGPAWADRRAEVDAALAAGSGRPVGRAEVAG
jgi:tRNA threonylcarbamoyladenosine biosynthesis protein TsaE